MSNIDIQALHEQFQSIFQMAIYHLKALKKKSILSRSDIAISYNFFDSFNLARLDLLKLQPSLKFIVNIKNYPKSHYTKLNHDNLIGLLNSLIIECSKALGIIKSCMKYNFSDNEKDKIDSIRKQINLMNLSTLVEKNITKAINNFEIGNFLACSLITSRVITYTINKFPIEYIPDKKVFIKKGSAEKKIEFLTDNNIIKKEQKDQKLRTIKYIKKARDFLVHDLNISPDASDAISLLGDCLDILKIKKDVDSLKEILVSEKMNSNPKNNN